MVKLRLELFHTPCKGKTSEMRLSFTTNSFVIGHINHKNAPSTFSVNLAIGELAKCF